MPTSTIPYTSLACHPTEFGLTSDQFASKEGYYAQLQALSTVQGVQIRLYEADEYDITKEDLPYTEYSPAQDVLPRALAYIMRDGDTHHALHPEPESDPDSSISSAEEEDDENEEDVPPLT